MSSGNYSLLDAGQFLHFADYFNRTTQHPEVKIMTYVPLPELKEVSIISRNVICLCTFSCHGMRENVFV